MIEYLTILIPETVFVIMISDFICLERNKKNYILILISVLLCTLTFHLFIAVLLDIVLIIIYLKYNKTELKTFIKTILFIILLFAIFDPIYLIVELCLKYMSSTPNIYMFEDMIIQNKLISSIIVSLITYSGYQIFLKPYQKEGINLVLYIFMYFVTPSLTILGLFILQKMIFYINIPNAYLYGCSLAIILFIMNLTFVRILYDKIRTDKFNHELENINKKSQEQIRLYNRLKKSNDDMLFVLHDIKNQISILSNDDSQNVDYIKDLYGKFGHLKKYCYTNDILNIYLEEQEEICKKCSIQCRFHIDRIDFSFIQDIDMITLLTPSFEFSFHEKNSVDAIHMTIMNHNQMIFIHFLMNTTNNIYSLELDNHYRLLSNLLLKYNGSVSSQKNSNKLELSLLLSVN